MSKLPVSESAVKRAPGWMVYVLASVFVVVACYLAFFRSDIGLVRPANAQANLTHIGEQAAGQIAAGESKTSLNQAGQAGQAPPREAAGASTGGAEGLVLNEPSNVPGESAETPSTEGEALPTGEGSLYYTDCSLIGGPHITELDELTLKTQITQISLIASQPDAIKNIMVQTLLPVLERFQVMVSPQWKPNAGRSDEIPPWLVTGTRRYSPFDVVGGGGPPVGLSTHPIPPFPSLAQVGGGARKPEVSAAQVASGLKLVGVMGEPGNYQAILTGAGKQFKLGVGDQITQIGDAVFIVMDISLGAVRIANKDKPSDQGLVQFVSRQGISNLSISY